MTSDCIQKMNKSPSVFFLLKSDLFSAFIISRLRKPFV